MVSFGIIIIVISLYFSVYYILHVVIPLLLFVSMEFSAPPKALKLLLQQRCLFPMVPREPAQALEGSGRGADEGPHPARGLVLESFSEVW